MDTAMPHVYTTMVTQSSGLPSEGPNGYASGMSFGDRVRQRRLALGLSQERLARALDVSKNTISRWETAHTEAPSGPNLDAVAKVLGTTSDWLLHGTRTPVTDEAAPPYWQEFLDRYEHLEAFTEEQLADLRDFVGRQMEPRSWVDWESIADRIRVARPSRRTDD